MELQELGNSKSDIASKIQSLTGGALRAIVKVKKSKYVPQGFIVRSWMDDFMFTADLPKKAAKAVLSDDKIDSISLSGNLQLIR